VEPPLAAMGYENRGCARGNEEADLVSFFHPTFKGTTDSAHQLPIAPKLLGQDFSCDPRGATPHAKAPGQVRLSDITYLSMHEGWLCLCAVLDLFTRRIVGGTMADPSRHAAMDERRRQLLRQRADGKFLACDEGRTAAWSGRCYSR